MRRNSLALSLLLAGGAAQAADVPQPHPAAPGGAIAAAKAKSRPLATVMASPTIMETTAVRMPDGTIGLICEQKRNLNPRPISPNKAFPEPQQ
jgi:hypothetical protein